MVLVGLGGLLQFVQRALVKFLSVSATILVVVLIGCAFVAVAARDASRRTERADH